MTSNDYQEESLKKALKEQDKRVKEALVSDSWLVDESITDKALIEEYKKIDEPS